MRDHIVTVQTPRANAATPPAKVRRTEPSPQSAPRQSRVVAAPRQSRVVATPQRAPKAGAKASPPMGDGVWPRAAEPSEAELLEIALGAKALPPKKNSQRDTMRAHQIAQGVASEKTERKFTKIGTKLGIVKAQVK